jgi:hypothetical protein
MNDLLENLFQPESIWTIFWRILGYEYYYHSYIGFLICFVRTGTRWLKHKLFYHLKIYIILKISFHIVCIICTFYYSLDCKFSLITRNIKREIKPTDNRKLANTNVRMVKLIENQFTHLDVKRQSLWSK